MMAANVNQNQNQVNEGQEQLIGLRYDDFESSFHDYFKSLWEQKSCTDVSIICKGEIFRAHKMVLAAMSLYFQAALEEPNSLKDCLTIHNIPDEHMRWILQYMYSGEVFVPDGKLMDFLTSASRLQILGIGI